MQPRRLIPLVVFLVHRNPYHEHLFLMFRLFSFLAFEKLDLRPYVTESLPLVARFRRQFKTFSRLPTC